MNIPGNPGRYWLYLAGCSVLFLAACDNYNFSRPQPADVQNRYEFPDAFRGDWLEEPDTTDPVPVNKADDPGGPIYRETGQNPDSKLFMHSGISSDDSSVYRLEKKYIRFIVYQSDKVVLGAWPRKGADNKLQYPYAEGQFYQTEQTIRYDSLNQPLDTMKNYLVSGNMIYEMNRDRFLGKGYPFTTDHDTLVVNSTDTVYIDLGQNAMLRPLTDSLFALNIRKGLLDMDYDDEWWMLVLLELTPSGKLLKWEVNERCAELNCMLYERPSKSEYYYFNCNWTKEELIRLKQKGYFSKIGLLRKK